MFQAKLMIYSLILPENLYNHELNAYILVNYGKIKKDKKQIFCYYWSCSLARFQGLLYTFLISMGLDVFWEQRNLGWVNMFR